LIAVNEPTYMLRSVGFCFASYQPVDKAKRRNLEIHSSAGVAEWLSRWPRDRNKQKGQNNR
jgi:hypothetical protein